MIYFPVCAIGADSDGGDPLGIEGTEEPIFSRLPLIRSVSELEWTEDPQ